ncbi:MAG: DUF1573 domain-containing protein [Phycisphaerae bacterium]
MTLSLFSARSTNLAHAPRPCRLFRLSAWLLGAALAVPAMLNPSFLRGAAVPSLFSEVHGRQMVDNCAINVTAFALEFFRRQVSLPQVADQLGVGGDWEQAADMLQIKQALKSEGLQVAAYKSATFRDISNKLRKYPQRSLAIIFLKNDLGVGEFGHYLVLLTGSSKRFFAVDIGAASGWASVKGVQDRIGPDFSGLVLFVRPGGAPKPLRVYPLTRRHIAVRVGEVAAGPGMIKIPFLLRNTAGQPIRIAIARGTCYCFRGATIDTPNRAIAPGQIGKITLKFKRSVIGIGSIEREVLLQFSNDPKHVLEVVVQAHITATHPPIQLTWYPSQIDFGVIRHRKALSGEEFTVLTPQGESLSQPVSSSKNISVIALVSPDGQVQTDDFGRTVHNYVIDLAKLPKGFVNDKVTITTTDNHVPKIVIPISGEVEK